MAAKTPSFHLVPPPDADFTAIWAFLEEGLDHIMNKPSTGMSYHEYMALSTVSYNYCISPDPVRKFLPTGNPATHPSVISLRHPPGVAD